MHSSASAPAPASEALASLLARVLAGADGVEKKATFEAVESSSMWQGLHQRLAPAEDAVLAQVQAGERALLSCLLHVPFPPSTSSAAIAKEEGDAECGHLLPTFPEIEEDFRELPQLEELAFLRYQRRRVQERQDVQRRQHQEQHRYPEEEENSSPPTLPDVAAFVSASVSSEDEKRTRQRHTTTVPATSNLSISTPSSVRGPSSAVAQSPRDEKQGARRKPQGAELPVFLSTPPHSHRKQVDTDETNTSSHGGSPPQAAAPTKAEELYYHYTHQQAGARAATTRIPPPAALHAAKRKQEQEQKRHQPKSEREPQEGTDAETARHHQRQPRPHMLMPPEPSLISSSAPSAGGDGDDTTMSASGTAATATPGQGQERGNGFHDYTIDEDNEEEEELGELAAVRVRRLRAINTQRLYTGASSSPTGRAVVLFPDTDGDDDDDDDNGGVGAAGERPSGASAGGGVPSSSSSSLSLSLSPLRRLTETEKDRALRAWPCVVHQYAQIRGNLEQAWLLWKAREARSEQEGRQPPQHQHQQSAADGGGEEKESQSREVDSLLSAIKASLYRTAVEFPVPSPADGNVEGGESSAVVTLLPSLLRLCLGSGSGDSESTAEDVVEAMLREFTTWLLDSGSSNNCSDGGGGGSEGTAHRQQGGKENALDLAKAIDRQGGRSTHPTEVLQRLEDLLLYTTRDLACRTESNDQSGESGERGSKAVGNVWCKPLVVAVLRRFPKAEAEGEEDGNEGRGGGGLRVRILPASEVCAADEKTTLEVAAASRVAEEAAADEDAGRTTAAAAQPVKPVCPTTAGYHLVVLEVTGQEEEEEGDQHHDHDHDCVEDAGGDSDANPPDVSRTRSHRAGSLAHDARPRRRRSSSSSSTPATLSESGVELWQRIVSLSHFVHVAGTQHEIRHTARYVAAAVKRRRQRSGIAATATAAAGGGGAVPLAAINGNLTMAEMMAQKSVYAFFCTITTTREALEKGEAEGEDDGRTERRHRRGRRRSRSALPGKRPKSAPPQQRQQHQYTTLSLAPPPPPPPAPRAASSPVKSFFSSPGRGLRSLITAARGTAPAPPQAPQAEPEQQQSSSTVKKKEEASSSLLTTDPASPPPSTPADAVAEWLYHRLIPLFIETTHTAAAAAAAAAAAEEEEESAPLQHQQREEGSKAPPPPPPPRSILLSRVQHIPAEMFVATLSTRKTEEEGAEEAGTTRATHLSPSISLPVSLVVPWCEEELLSYLATRQLFFREPLLAESLAPSSVSSGDDDAAFGEEEEEEDGGRGQRRPSPSLAPGAALSPSPRREGSTPGPGPQTRKVSFVEQGGERGSAARAHADRNFTGTTSAIMAEGHSPPRPPLAPSPRQQRQQRQQVLQTSLTELNERGSFGSPPRSILKSGKRYKRARMIRSSATAASIVPFASLMHWRWTVAEDGAESAKSGGGSGGGPSFLLLPPLVKAGEEVGREREPAEAAPVAADCFSVSAEAYVWHVRDAAVLLACEVAALGVLGIATAEIAASEKLSEAIPLTAAPREEEVGTGGDGVVASVFHAIQRNHRKEAAVKEDAAALGRRKCKGLGRTDVRRWVSAMLRTSVNAAFGPFAAFLPLLPMSPHRHHRRSDTSEGPTVLASAGGGSASAFSRSTSAVHAHPSRLDDWPVGLPPPHLSATLHQRLSALRDACLVEARMETHAELFPFMDRILNRLSMALAAEKLRALSQPLSDFFDSEIYKSAAAAAGDERAGEGPDCQTADCDVVAAAGRQLAELCDQLTLHYETCLLLPHVVFAARNRDSEAEVGAEAREAETRLSSPGPRMSATLASSSLTRSGSDRTVRGGFCPIGPLESTSLRLPSPPPPPKGEDRRVVRADEGGDVGGGGKEETSDPTSLAYADRDAPHHHFRNLIGALAPPWGSSGSDDDGDDDWENSDMSSILDTLANGRISHLVPPRRVAAGHGATALDRMAFLRAGAASSDGAPLHQTGSSNVGGEMHGVKAEASLPTRSTLDGSGKNLTQRPRDCAAGTAPSSPAHEATAPLEQDHTAATGTPAAEAIALLSPLWTHRRPSLSSRFSTSRNFFRLSISLFLSSTTTAVAAAPASDDVSYRQQRAASRSQSPSVAMSLSVAAFDHAFTILAFTRCASTRGIVSMLNDSASNTSRGWRGWRRDAEFSDSQGATSGRVQGSSSPPTWKEASCPSDDEEKLTPLSFSLAPAPTPSTPVPSSSSSSLELLDVHESALIHLWAAEAKSILFSQLFAAWILPHWLAITPAGKKPGKGGDTVEGERKGEVSTAEHLLRKGGVEAATITAATQTDAKSRKEGNKGDNEAEADDDVMEAIKDQMGLLVRLCEAMVADQAVPSNSDGGGKDDDGDGNGRLPPHGRETPQLSDTCEGKEGAPPALASTTPHANFDDDDAAGQQQQQTPQATRRVSFSEPLATHVGDSDTKGKGSSGGGGGASVSTEGGGSKGKAWQVLQLAQHMLDELNGVGRPLHHPHTANVVDVPSYRHPHGPGKCRKTERPDDDEDDDGDSDHKGSRSNGNGTALPPFLQARRPKGERACKTASPSNTKDMLSQGIQGPRCVSPLSEDSTYLRPHVHTGQDVPSILTSGGPSEAYAPLHPVYAHNAAGNDTFASFSNVVPGAAGGVRLGGAVLGGSNNNSNASSAFTSTGTSGNSPLQADFATDLARGLFGGGGGGGTVGVCGSGSGSGPAGGEKNSSPLLGMNALGGLYSLASVGLPTQLSSRAESENSGGRKTTTTTTVDSLGKGSQPQQQRTPREWWPLFAHCCDAGTQTTPPPPLLPAAVVLPLATVDGFPATGSVSVSSHENSSSTDEDEDGAAGRAPPPTASTNPIATDDESGGASSLTPTDTTLPTPHHLPHHGDDNNSGSEPEELKKKKTKEDDGPATPPTPTDSPPLAEENRSSNASAGSATERVSPMPTPTSIGGRDKGNTPIYHADPAALPGAAASGSEPGHMPLTTALPTPPPPLSMNSEPDAVASREAAKSNKDMARHPSRTIAADLENEADTPSYLASLMKTPDRSQAAVAAIADLQNQLSHSGHTAHQLSHQLAQAREALEARDEQARQLHARVAELEAHLAQQQRHDQQPQQQQRGESASAVSDHLGEPEDGVPPPLAPPVSRDADNIHSSGNWSNGNRLSDADLARKVTELEGELASARFRVTQWQAVVDAERHKHLVEVDQLQQQLHQLTRASRSPSTASLDLAASRRSPSPDQLALHSLLEQRAAELERALRKAEADRETARQEARHAKTSAASQALLHEAAIRQLQGELSRSKDAQDEAAERVTLLSREVQLAREERATLENKTREAAELEREQQREREKLVADERREWECRLAAEAAVARQAKQWVQALRDERGQRERERREKEVLVENLTSLLAEQRTQTAHLQAALAAARATDGKDAAGDKEQAEGGAAAAVQQAHEHIARLEQQLTEALHSATAEHVKADDLAMQLSSLGGRVAALQDALAVAQSEKATLAEEAEAARGVREREAEEALHKQATDAEERLRSALKAQEQRLTQEHERVLDTTRREHEKALSAVKAAAEGEVMARVRREAERTRERLVVQAEHADASQGAAIESHNYRVIRYLSNWRLVYDRYLSTKIHYFAESALLLGLGVPIDTDTANSSSSGLGGRRGELVAKAQRNTLVPHQHTEHPFSSFSGSPARESGAALTEGKKKKTKLAHRQRRSSSSSSAPRAGDAGDRHGRDGEAVDAEEDDDPLALQYELGQKKRQIAALQEHVTQLERARRQDGHTMDKYRELLRMQQELSASSPPTSGGGGDVDARLGLSTTPPRSSSRQGAVLPTPHRSPTATVAAAPTPTTTTTREASAPPTSVETYLQRYASLQSSLRKSY